MKVIFLGTPDFAVPSLKAIINSKHQVVACVTQPDKAVGRSNQLVFGPVKKVALENNVKVLQYNKIRLEGVEDLKNLKADIMVTCAFGQILSQEIIDICPKGIINIHGSLLPKYRGASPIQWSILNGDSETGITIMQTQAGIDCGDILLTEKTPIKNDETAGELFDRLSIMGSRLIVEALDKIENGTAHFTPQEHEKATFVKMLKKQDGIIDFNSNYETLLNFVRGMNPWPSAFTYYNGKMFKIHKASYVSENSNNLKCGSLFTSKDNKMLYCACKNAIIRLEEIQIEGKKSMTDSVFLLGHKIVDGEMLG